MTLRSVLHVAQPVDAGVPHAAAELVRDQVARGWRVTVATPPDSRLRELASEAGASWRSWPASRSPGPSTASEAVRLAAIVRRVAPDLVHLHSAKAGLAGRLAVGGRRPTVFQPHAWSFEAAGRAAAAVKAWERAAVRWTDLIVCVSEDERRRGEEVGVSARYAVAPNGIDLVRWTPADDEERAAARRRLGVGDEPLGVLVGRLAEQKGQDLALRAWELVRARVPAATLALVGDGPDRAVLEAAAGDGVVFTGGGADVAAWLAAADVVLMASRWEAGLTLSAMEAMARSRSVVSFATAGMEEGLGGAAGAVVGTGDVEALARAAADRLADPDLAAREGRAGRRRVEERYDVRVTAARVAELYVDALRAAR